MRVFRGPWLVVEREQPPECRSEIFRVVGDDLTVVFLEVNGGLDNSDGLIVDAVNQESADLLNGNHVRGVNLILVKAGRLNADKGCGVVLDGSVNAVHHLVARRQHFVHKDAALHFLSFRIEVEDTDNQRNS